MPNLSENTSWDATVYQFATTDPIQGGPGGIDNQPHQSLADRTQWLRARIAAAINQSGLTDGTTDNTQLAQAVVLQCATAATLRSVPVPVVPNSQTVLMITRGQAVDGDGYGAAYKWVYNSTAADNGSSVIAPTGVTTGRWLARGFNATALGGEPASYYATLSQIAALYETLAGAAANLTAAENFATSAANTAQSNAESYASSVAGTAQTNAENFANTAVAGEASARAAAVSAEASARASAVSSAISTAESFASGVANTAQANAEAYASNASNLTSGTVANARLPNLASMPGVIIQADPGTVPSLAPGQVAFYY